MSMSRRSAPAALQTRTDLTSEAVDAVTDALNPLLADAFALYLKTKNFHWHVSGPHFRDYHLLLDEQGDQIFAMTDELAERVRKIGGVTVKSIGEVARLQRIKDNDEEFVAAVDMLREFGSVTGLDMSPTAVAYCQARFGSAVNMRVGPSPGCAAERPRIGWSIM